MKIIQIPCRHDNYAVLIHDDVNNITLLFDAPEHKPIARILNDNGWSLDAILISHYHYDHIEAAASLKNQYNCKIFAPNIPPDELVEVVDDFIQDLKQIRFGDIHIQILKTPGHTLEHLAFYIKNQKIAILADSLFSLGCGRILNGTAAQLFKTMQIIKNLPDDTQLYCGHEYTQANGKFALAVDSQNPDLQTRIKQVDTLRQNNQPTLPTLLADEKRTNPFLRYDDNQIRQNLDMLDASDEQVFTKLRQMKDVF